MTTTASERAKRDRLRSLLRQYESVLVGYSGGVDSVLVAAVALAELGPERVLAVTGRSASLAGWMEATAREVARRLGVPWVEIDTNELADPRYVANAPDRCFYCKNELWGKLTALAAERGLRTVVDGTNADDALAERPGWAAGQRWGVRSPLREAGLTKAEVRRWSRDLGLPTWDAPASPCLASRVVHGLAVTPGRLQQIELAERALRRDGWRDLRVRHHGNLLRLEVPPEEVTAAAAAWPRVRAALRTAAPDCAVGLDPLGYRGARAGAAADGVAMLATTGAEVVLRGAARDVAWVRAPAAAFLRLVETGGGLVAALCRGGVRFVAVDTTDA